MINQSSVGLMRQLLHVSLPFLLALGPLFNSSVYAQSGTPSPSVQVYTVGAVPPQEVRQGKTLQFQLQATHVGSATFSYTLDQTGSVPQGALSLDSSSGLFTYTPASADKFEFSLKFVAQIPGAPLDSQNVLITPVSSLPPETDLVSSTQPMPDPSSTDYQLVTLSQNSARELFNGTQQSTWSAEISGKVVIFDSSTLDHGGLYTRFNNRPDLKYLSIYAETVIMRSPLKLPGTNVTVYARHLRFEDAAGQASLDTTPVGFPTRASQYQDGASGQKGGDITLHIQDFSSPSGQTVRFVTHGGAGQDAGEGRPGNPKPDIVPSAPNAGNWGSGPWSMRWGPGVGRVVLDWPFYQQTWGWVLDQNGQPLPQNPTPYPSVIYVRCDPCGQYVGGQPVWPADGEDAVPPGTPGTGGSGGTVFSSVDVSAFVQISGGPSGQPGSAQAGGPPQNPTYSAWLQTIDGTRCNDDFFNFQLIGVHRSIAGKYALSVPPAQPRGSDGSFVLLADPTSLSWLHPYLLRMVMAHAKDTYRVGDLHDAQLILQDYSTLLDQFSVFPDTFAFDFKQTQAEIEALLHRLANNLDYFSHTAAWVPLLSLEATMNAFSSEVDAAVPVLILSQWLQLVASQNLKDTAALQDTMNQLSDEALSTANRVNTALGNVPALQQQAAQINSNLQTVQVLLQQREAQLVQQAQHDLEAQRQLPFWKKSLRLIGTVAQTVPAYQPALGTIGKGLDFVTTFDSSQPLQSLQNAPDLTSLFKDKTWTDSEANFNNFLKSVDFRSFSNAKSFANELGDAYKAHQDLIKQTIQQLQTTQIADSDVQKEFEQLKAQDTRFNDLIGQVAELQTQKQLFAQAVTNTLQEIASDQATMNKDLLSVASMYDNLNTTVAQFDHGMMGYVLDMDRRARERLLRYQYYMAKSYEYYMLQPYPGDLNVDSLVNKILAVMNTDKYSALTNPADIAAIKAVYLDSVRQIISSALTQLQTQPPERSLPFFFSLTDPQLKQLNDSGQLTLDLSPLIAGLPNEDNRHLSDLNVANITVQTQGNLGPATRLRIVINHQGESTEKLNGHRYQFHFGNGPNDQPFTWGASYNLPSGPLSQETLSVNGLSLLQSFLNISGPTDPLMTPLTLFARPGADAVVNVMMVREPADLNVQLTNLQFSATVDFFRTQSNQSRLSVQTANGILPYISADHPDVTGRSDGLGSFERTYTLGDSVILTAEPEYGSMRFREYDDDSGKLLGLSTTLTLALTSSAVVRPVYVGAPQTIFNISGRVVDGTGSAVPNVAILLSGAQSTSTLSGVDGTYQFTSLPTGDYTLVPSKTGLAFVPPAVNLTALADNQIANFVAMTSTCSYSIAPNSQSFDSGGGIASLVVNTQNNCTWTAVSSDPTVTIISGKSGTGSGTITYSVGVNSTSSPRSLTIAIADQVLTITQLPAPVPIVTLSSSSLNFSNQLVGSTSSTQTVTLTNSGTAILNVISIELTGDGRDEFVINDAAHCEPVIQAGGSCTTTVSFTPHHVGSQAANLILNDDAAGSPQIVNLSGSGAGYTISAPQSVSAVAGQNADIPITVAPTGSYRNHVSFSVVRGLPPGTACTFVPAQIFLDGKNSVVVTANIATTATSAGRITNPIPLWLLELRWGRVSVVVTVFLLAVSIKLRVSIRMDMSRMRATGRVSSALLTSLIVTLLSVCFVWGCGQIPNGPKPSGPGAAPVGNYSIVFKASSDDFETQTVVTLTVSPLH
jgi:hypothetical protein